MIINVFFHYLRVLILKLKNKICTLFLRTKLLTMNVNYGKNVKALNGVPLIIIHSKVKKCQIGNNVIFRSYQDVCWNSNCYVQVKKNATFIFGDNSGISGTMIYCQNKIEIGRNVMIGGGCRIFDTDFHPLEVEKRIDPRFVNDGVSAPIHIEDDVFIGTNCIIGKGVRIGQGSVVAAGSVVVKSIPSNEIWGGNPARFIRKV